ncbi:N-acetylglucosamine-6-phosphate deacetylase [Sporosarcina sp. Te-1]|uniref:N-acetylglucosamine-6-phosphate deacetylase n=1 Tax=Sporosarcina sp. Te-1 TaxID=2818390 RepID=UPI001A9E1D7D|nr:N-acetylglucosamine-6-phosphate deacetylase [Sporosarcina sp. Te-1]QTD40968.1 N-acetylglucosamine-6-phosphate deacetylase [Sporosarcina sp. Te-1]
MNSLWIINATIVLEDSVINWGYVCVEDGKITSVGKMETCPQLMEDESIIDCKNEKTVIPGMIDIHVHGACGYDTMDANRDALAGIAQGLVKEGTTSFLATTMTNPKNLIEGALQAVREYRSEKGKPGIAELLGIHLEGPFINPKQKGAQPEVAIIGPDIELFHEWQRLSGGAIKIATIAPEMGSLTFVQELVKEGVILSIGHSDATYDEAQAAIQQGVTHATHLFNGMRGIHHRDPGVAGAALIADEVFVELIPDGHHVHPDLLKLVMRQKGAGRVLVITDGMRAKGMPDGEYDLGGNEVVVKDGRCVLGSGNSLAGSVVTMDEARRNMAVWCQLSLVELSWITSLNQAKRLGIESRKGSISAGKDADIVILNRTGHVDATICNGTMAYLSGGLKWQLDEQGAIKERKQASN